MTIRLDPKKTDFPAYPAQELAFSLSSVKVEAVSAIFHRCRPGWKIKERRMPDDMIFWFVSGRARFKVGAREFEAVPGDCLHLPRNTPQAAVGDVSDPPDVIVIHYHARAFGGIPLAALVGFPTRLKIGEDTLHGRLMEEACREFQHQPPGWQEGLNAKVWELLLHFIRHRDATHAHPATEEWRNLARLQPALQKMEETLADPATMAVLAQSCGFSEAQFRRVFRRAVGTSPVAYLRSRRMEEACLLLRETDLKVEDIAARVGYTEPGFFWSTFKKLIHETPSNYRRLALQNRI